MEARYRSVEAYRQRERERREVELIERRLREARFGVDMEVVHGEDPR